MPTRLRYLAALLLLLPLIASACRPASDPADLASGALAAPQATAASQPTVQTVPDTPMPPTETPTPPTETPVPAGPGFSGAAAYELVLSQMDFGPRPTGSAAGWATGDWIIATLQAAGWQTEGQEFEYLGVTGRNIVGRMPASDGEPVIILGAHYDTRRVADSDPANPDQPVLGANDGASGVAVLLELARALEPGKIPYQVWLVFFDAEDNGRLDGWDWIVGSTQFAAGLTVRPQFVVVVDMIGDADQQIYYEANSDPAVMAALWRVAAGLGYQDTIIPEYNHSMLDDHTPFVRLGIPAVDMIDFDYPYYHTVEDTADKVSAESLERVGRTIEVYLESTEAN